MPRRPTFLKRITLILDFTFGGFINVLKIKEDITDRKLFTSWAMRGDPVKSWMWSYEDVESGIVKKIKPADAFAVFEKLSREIDQFT